MQGHRRYKGDLTVWFKSYLCYTGKSKRSSEAGSCCSGVFISN